MISNLVGSEVCSTTDVYELTGIGDDSSTAITNNQWQLMDDASSTISIIGNVLEDDVNDWFVVSSLDDINEDRAYEIDYYKIDIDLVGNGDYSFLVYKNGFSAANQECLTQNSYTSYSDYNEDQGGVFDDGTLRLISSPSNKCGDNSVLYNNCEDNSAIYYIHVFRNTPVNSCQAYELTITNGVWP